MMPYFRQNLLTNAKCFHFFTAAIHILIVASPTENIYFIGSIVLLEKIVNCFSENFRYLIDIDTVHLQSLGIAVLCLQSQYVNTAVVQQYFDD